MEENTEVSQVAEQPMPPPQIKRKNKLYIVVCITTLLLCILGFVIYIRTVGPNVKKFQTDAYVAFRQGDFEKSESITKEGLVEFPNDIYLLKTAIDSRSAIGNQTGKEIEAFDKNKQYIEIAKKVGKNNSGVMITLGYAYETTGKYEEALFYYDQAIQLKQSAAAYFHKGHVLKFLNRNAEAKEHIKKAYDLEPENGYFQLAYSNILLEEGKENEAIELFLKSATNKNSSNSQRAEAYVALALVYSQNGEHNKVLDVTKKAMDLDPSNAMAMSLHGFALLLLDQPTKGISYIERSAKQNPRIVLNYMMKGMFLRGVGFYQDAIVLQEYGIENISKDNTLIGDSQKRTVLGLMHYELAQTYSMDKNNEKAIKNLRLAIQYNPLIKGSIPKSLQQGYFRNINVDPEFVALYE